MFTPLLTFQIVACWVADTVGLGDCAWSPPGDLPVPIAPSSHLDQPRISSPIVSPLIPARACSYAWQRFSSSTSPTTWGQCGLHNLHNITKSSGHDTGWRKMFTPLLTFQIVACWVADTVSLGDCAWSPPGDLPVPIAPSSHLDQPRISSPIVSPLIPARACSYAWQRFSSSTSPTTRLWVFEPYADAPMRIRGQPSSEQYRGGGDDGEGACAVEALLTRPRGRTSTCETPTMTLHSLCPYHRDHHG
ncbi:hypothetical protein MRX96_045497 [Rhipicephalus microplus]